MLCHHLCLGRGKLRQGFSQASGEAGRREEESVFWLGNQESKADGETQDPKSKLGLTCIFSPFQQGVPWLPSQMCLPSSAPLRPQPARASGTLLWTQTEGAEFEGKSRPSGEDGSRGQKDVPEGCPPEQSERQDRARTRSLGGGAGVGTEKQGVGARGGWWWMPEPSAKGLGPGGRGSS